MGAKINLNEKNVVKSYNEHKNVHKVAEIFNVSYTPIKRILTSNGYNLTNRRYTVNDEYFENIDTEEKAYWLGFLFADGYIRDRNHGKSLEMKLGIKDKNHLELFRKCIKSTHNITESFNKVKYKDGYSISHLCWLAIYSDKLVESIKKQGVHSRKTFTIQPPLNVPKKLLRHFIRGYFDGDGCICFNRKTKRGVVGIVSASPNFKKFLIEFILKECNVPTIYEGNIEIQIQTKFGIVNFLSYIYKNSKIYLKRKKDIYDEFERYVKQKP